MLAQSVPGVRQRSLLDAFRSLRALIDDPSDTAHGFRLVEALDPLIHHRELASMSSAPSGERLLRERPVLLHALRDRDALAALPEGSLGRAYLEFCLREGLHPDGFVEVGEAGSQLIEDPAVRYAAHRARDTHDLWHVVAGYRTDMAGEVAILAFVFAQTRSPGLLLLLFGGILHSFLAGLKTGNTMRHLAWRGLQSGFRAGPLAAAPWEEWLGRPLDQVRAELGIGDAPTYEPAWAPPR